MCTSFCMWRNSLFLLLLLPGMAAHAADVCDPAKLAGPYAFQLSGPTTISGTPKPTASLGRIVFDGSSGVSGTASATFSGLLLGNPVTGTYEAKSDCSVTWKLQDDSGAFQNFSGTLSTDAGRPILAALSTGSCRRFPIRARWPISRRNTNSQSSGAPHRCSPAKYRKRFPSKAQSMLPRMAAFR